MTNAEVAAKDCEVCNGRGWREQQARWMFPCECLLNAWYKTLKPGKPSPAFSEWSCGEFSPKTTAQTDLKD